MPTKISGKSVKSNKTVVFFLCLKYNYDYYILAHCVLTRHVSQLSLAG